ncbi:MAG: phosphotransferase [Bacteroidota bacterium]
MNSNPEAFICQATNSNKVVHREDIQALWSDYGVITRFFLEGGNYESVVVKRIFLKKAGDHPRGWNTNVSHQRKLKSYEVEFNWYQHYAKQCDENCALPAYIDSTDFSDERLLIIEDLNAIGYPLRKSTVDLSEIKSCLKWLAAFHAKFMHVESEGLWDKGSYWYLQTRMDEYEAMQDEELKNVAFEIDRVLDNCQYKTVIHGDAKLANFCFSEDGQSVAAVDFQYVGKGSGMKDVAYFLSSCLTEDQLIQNEKSLLKYYFNQLEVSLSNEGLDIDSQLVIKEWGELYNYAWADFYRFLDGWSPQHWKIHRYSKQIRDQVIKSFKSI